MQLQIPPNHVSRKGYVMQTLVWMFYFSNVYHFASLQKFNNNTDHMNTTHLRNFKSTV